MHSPVDDVDCLRNRGQVFWMAGLLLVLATSPLDAQAYFITAGQSGTIDLDTGVATTLGPSIRSTFAAGLGQIRRVAL